MYNTDIDFLILLLQQFVFMACWHNSGTDSAFQIQTTGSFGMVLNVEKIIQKKIYGKKENRNNSNMLSSVRVQNK